MRRFPTLAIAVTIGLIAGCGAGKIREDRAAFDAGYKAFKAGQWLTAVDGFNRYLRSCPTSPTRGEIYYYRGESLVHLNRRKEAQADFERALGAKAPEPILSFARVATANLYYEDGNDTKAIEKYAEVLRGPTDELPMDMIYLRVGVSLQRVGRWKDADRYLGRVIERYGDSQAAIEARRRVNGDGFSVQTGAFASPAAAAQESARLKAAGFQPRVTSLKKGSQSFCAVQVGKAPTYAEAMTLARQVTKAGFTAMIVP